MSPVARPADPVFVGGAARSGLQAVARLIGAHGHYHYLDAQARFHADEGGLADLLAGRVELDRFLERLRGHWWFHTRAADRESGLHQLVSRDDFERAVTEFEGGFPDDPDGASRRLLRSLFDPVARHAGAQSWVEWTTRSVAAAPALARVLPDCRLVHVVRDGRDVACSLVSHGSGLDSVVSAVTAWERQLRAADAAAREVAPDRVLTLDIEELAITDREATYERLLDFLGIEDDRGIREHFENKLLPGAANPGRWEIDLADHQQRELERAYSTALERLRADDVGPAKDLLRRSEVTGTDRGGDTASGRDRLPGPLG